MADLSTVLGRSKLKARTPPYWQRLSTGAHVGYRKMTSASEGSWLAQHYDPATRKQVRRSLGTFSTLPEHQRYDAAKKAAEAWFQHLGHGGAADSMSVREACVRYVAHLRAEGKGSTADDAMARFRRWVDDAALARIDVRKLAAHHVWAWRQSLIAAPVIVNPYADEDAREERARSPASVNRDMSALRAALNHALESGAATNDAAWRMALGPILNAERRRELYLDRKQRAALISSAPTDLAALLKGLALVPLRPGALAALTAGSFDKRLSTLVIGKDKAGGERRIKLPADTAAFFAAQCKDKLPTAPLFARADGKAWDKDSWKRPVKAAAAAAELPATTTAYSLRHSVITDLIGAGLDVLTVARLSGTSVAMIERHYGHLRADHAAAALAALAL